MMEETILFAQKELKKYQKLVTGQEQHAIRLETDPALGRALYGERFDAMFDDGYAIDISASAGKIAGTNARSVLLGVYRYFYLLGCRFFRAGKGGEILVRRKAEECSAKETRKPEYRHRGITIEGSCSIGNVLDMIDWMPKAGFNAYFLQFTDGYTFFEHHYNGDSNPLRSRKTYSEEKNAEHVRKLIGALKKRSLIYHAVGHGWTCLAMGRTYHGFTEQEKKEEFPMLAQIGGRRGFFKGEPLNTQLCYSREEVRQQLAETVARYAEEHREIDVLHVWLADNFNNFCTCDSCRRTTPSDDYVDLLNRIDGLLTKSGLPTRIVFLIYYELLWPPVKARLKNPDRFILMFAPISRTFCRSYLEEVHTDFSATALPEYRRNEMVLPATVRENLAFLKEWQKVFSGDSFVFDYHMMWDVFRDKGIVNLAKVLFDDLEALRSFGLGGYVSCQIQRAFFPNGLTMYVMSQKLSGTEKTFEELAEEYCSLAYGGAADTAAEFFAFVEKWLPHAAVRGDRNFTAAEIADIRARRGELRAFRERLLGYGGEGAFAEEEIRRLVSYIELLGNFADLLLIKCDRGRDAARKAYEYDKKVLFAYEYLWGEQMDAFENDILNDSFIEMRENFDKN